MEKYQSRKRDLHMIFIDLEITYDRVQRKILWKALEKKRVHIAYIQVIKDMYNRATKNVRTPGGLTKDFPIKIGLHQGLSLSLYIFTLVLDVCTEHIPNAVLNMPFYR